MSKKSSSEKKSSSKKPAPQAYAPPSELIASSLYESAFIYGAHEANHEHPWDGDSHAIMYENSSGKGWIVFHLGLANMQRDAAGKLIFTYNISGGNFSQWANWNYGVIVRLNFGYADSWVGSEPRVNMGTLPYESDYDNFATAVGQYVANSSGAHIWVIGNETNFWVEWPNWDQSRATGRITTIPDGVDLPQSVIGSEPITSERYAKCFIRCRDAIRRKAGHEQDQVIMSGVAPWNTNLEVLSKTHPDRLWTEYYKNVFAQIIEQTGHLRDANNPRYNDGYIDGIALHTYTHGASHKKIDGTDVLNFNGYQWAERDEEMQSEQHNPEKPGDHHLRYQFRTYIDFMNATPEWAQGLPVYITETDQNAEWANENPDKEVPDVGGTTKIITHGGGWVKAAYQEINRWNTEEHKQKIRALCLYRFNHVMDGNRNFYIGDKTRVVEDFKEAIARNYRWDQLFGHKIFDDIWRATDLHTSEHRTMLWGRETAISSAFMERNDDSPGRARLVQYFDKARMEINDPHKTELIAGGWYVTTGHIVKEMIQGKYKINDGDDANSYFPHNKLTPPIAGDLTGNASAPTYWSFRSHLGVVRTGAVNLKIAKSGLVSTVTGMDARVQQYVNVDGHYIADIFYKYLNQDQAPISVTNIIKKANANLNWIYVSGYPITGAYWAEVVVKGQSPRWVLIQAFERRVLTFNPGNTSDDGGLWELEMGNAGVHYHNWRYKETQPEITAASLKKVSTSKVSKKASKPSTKAATNTFGGGRFVAGFAKPSLAADVMDRIMPDYVSSTEDRQVQLTLQNVGSAPWSAGQSDSPRLEPGDSDNAAFWRAGSVSLPHAVMVGGIVTVSVPVRAPSNRSGLFSFKLRMTGGEGGAWSGNHSTFNELMQIQGGTGGGTGGGGGTGEPVHYYQGYIDSADSRTVRGWAWDLHYLSSIIQVKVYLDHNRLAFVTANAQDPIRGGHGFIYQIPDQWPNGHSWLDGQPHMLTVNIDNNNVELGSNHGPIMITGALTNYTVRVVEDGNDAQGLQGASVTLKDNVSGAQLTGTTDANGSYTFNGIRTGTSFSYTLTASKSFYNIAGTSSFTFANDINPQSCVFRARLRTFSVYGKVLTTDEQPTALPIPGIEISLTGSNLPHVTTVADGAMKGTYRFDGVPAGSHYDVTASSPYYTFTQSSQAINQLAGDTQVDFGAARIRLPLGVKVSGEKVMGQLTGTLDGVNALLTGARIEPPTGITKQTDSAGTCSFPDLRKGRNYKVKVSHAHYNFDFEGHTSTQETADLPAGLVFQFVGKRNLRKISGTITDKSGFGLEPMSVIITSSESGFAQRTVPVVDGKFTCDLLPAGADYYVTPKETTPDPYFTYQPGGLTVTNLTDDTEVSAIEATRRLAPIAGYVIVGGSAVHGVSGVTVKASVNLPGQTSSVTTVQTKSNGDYTLNVAAGVPYNIEVSHADFYFAPSHEATGKHAIAKLSVQGATLPNFIGGTDLTATVKDAAGKAVSGVKLTLGDERNATTGADGKYTFQYMEPSHTFRITPSKGEMQFDPTFQLITLDAHGTPSPIPDFKGGYKISGVVTDALENPVTGVTVALSGPTPTQSQSASVSETGQYSFELLAPGGNYTVAASHPTQTCEPPRAVNNLAGNASANLKSGYTLGGTVTDAQGNSMQGVRLNLTRGSVVSGTMVTPVDGSYAFKYLRGRGYLLSPFKDGSDAVFIPANFDPVDINAHLNANFREAAIISGRVTADGRPLRGVSLMMMKSGEKTYAETDADGRYRFAVSPQSGDYEITPSLEQYVFAPTSRNFSDPLTAQAVDFEAIAQRVIRCAVVESRSPLPGVVLQLFGTPAQPGGKQKPIPVRPQLLDSGRSDAKGRCGFIFVPQKGMTYMVSPVAETRRFDPPSISFVDMSRDYDVTFGSPLPNQRPPDEQDPGPKPL